MAIRVRRGSDADRLTVILEEGEVAFTTDTQMFYVGDNVTLGGILIGPGAVVPTSWGTITGVLSNQLDLQAALNAKEPTIAAGLITDYWRGDKSWQPFPSIPVVTPAALTRVNDTNVTLTLGGTPTLALLQAASLTLGWTGTLADARITSSATWNAKQNAITLTTLGTSGVATFIANTLNIPNYADTGITTLNTLVALTQTFAVGTSGTDFAINSAISTHTFNLPTASALNRGALSSADWATFNSKQTAITLTTLGTSGASTLIGATLNIPQYTDTYLGTVTSVAALTLGTTGVDLSSTVANSTTTPVITLNVPTASVLNRGALSAADWSTFNSKQDAITLTTVGTTGSSTFIANTLNIPSYVDQFVGTVTSVGLTAPSAFTITGSPITTSGTLAITGAGLVSQYIDGTGALQTFPALSSGTVTNVATAGLISGGPITTTGTVTTSMNTNRLVGRGTAGAGIMEEIVLGTNLSLTGTTLNATGGSVSPLTTKGDLYTYDTTNARLPIGLDTQILLADSSTTTGLKWGTNTAATPTGYYGSFEDNTIQTAAAINTPYAMKFGITDLSNGITIVSDGSNLTRITIANTGVYNIQFSAQFDRTNSGTDAVDIWLRKNGVDVPGSGGKIILTGAAAASAIIAAWNYVLDIVAGDYYQIMWSTPDTHVRILYEAAQTIPFVHPIIPSTILTVTQQSGIMAGTGITAINSLTGAAQTMVAGTSGTDFAVSSLGTTHTLNLPSSSALNRGALTAADWTTFNNKGNGTVLSVTAAPGDPIVVDNIDPANPVISSGILVQGVTATSLITSSGGVTPNISTYMTTNKLVGRGTALSGVMEEIIIGTNLSLTGTTLNATNSGGTVTSVAALTLGTTGTDLSSTVATSTTTPVITLNVPTASALNRGALSSTDWTTFNNKGSGTVTSVSGTLNRIDSTGGTTPVINISATYVGQTSITTLGTIGTGVWNGTTIAIANGGTGQITNTLGFDALSPTTTRGDTIVRGVTNNVRLALGTVGQILRSDGTDLVYTTATYPTTTAVSTILYSSAANVISALATANNGILVTSATGVPSISAQLTYNTTTGTLLNSLVVNAAVSTTVTNTSTASSGFSQFVANSLSYTFQIQQLGTGYATNGLIVANQSRIASNSISSMLINTSAASVPIIFAVGGFAATNEAHRSTTSGIEFRVLLKSLVHSAANLMAGQITLVGGTLATTITGLTTSHRGMVTLVTPNNVLNTRSYQAVCTANTITIRANTDTGLLNPVDTSVLNYFIFLNN